MNTRVLAVLVCLIFSITTQADVIKIPIGEQGDKQKTDLPQRGESKSRVIATFGKPNKEYPAVGNPPITRWNYEEFDVYFEHEHVINSVQHFKPMQPISN